MALKYMETQEMIAASDSWVMAGTKANLVLTTRAVTAPFVGLVIDAHNRLVELSSPPDSLIAELVVEQTEVDDRHDALVRGIVSTSSVFRGR